MYTRSQLLWVCLAAAAAVDHRAHAGCLPIVVPETLHLTLESVTEDGRPWSGLARTPGRRGLLRGDWSRVYHGVVEVPGEPLTAEVWCYALARR